MFDMKKIDCGSVIESNGGQGETERAGLVRCMGGTIMAMPQQDDYIEQIHRLEGLMAYAEAQ